MCGIADKDEKIENFYESKEARHFASFIGIQTRSVRNVYYDSFNKMLINSGERFEPSTPHPVIPVILNNPNINELRWCHADFAYIPTKKGMNIIEMIT